MLRRIDVDGHVEVCFVIDGDSHRGPITVVGDFNDWDPTANPLQPDGDGTVSTAVRLAPGCRYAFRYRDADGRWFNDEAADDYCANDWGGMNGVVET